MSEAQRPLAEVLRERQILAAQLAALDAEARRTGTRPPAPPGRAAPARFRSRDRLLTIGEAAGYSGLSKRYLRRLCDERRIAFEVPRTGLRPWRRIRQSTLDGFMLRHGET